MKKKMMTTVMVCGLALASYTCVGASWLGDLLDSSSSVSSSGTSTRAQTTGAGSSLKREDRWSEIYKTDYYTIYVDATSLKKSGEAQHRSVEGWFKRVYTPEGSAWLGNNSGGRVKPDVITHSVYHAIYFVNNSDWGDWFYYDVKNHLIYEGSLADVRDENGFGRYVPDSPNEQIKDILFHAVGWDY